MDLCFAMQNKTVSSQESLQMEARQVWHDKASKVNILMSPMSYLMTGQNGEMGIEERRNKEWKLCEGYKGRTWRTGKEQSGGEDAGSDTAGRIRKNSCSEQDRKSQKM